MALQEGIINSKINESRIFINGRIITLYPKMFNISTNGGSSYSDLSTFGNPINMINCSDAGSTQNELKLMIPYDVTEASFSLSNDTNNPKNVTTLYFLDSLNLPINTTTLKNMFGVPNNNVSTLLSSSNINPNSPRISRNELYLPAGVDVNNLPLFVGNSDKTNPHRIGELAGYCHTAKAGFEITGGAGNWTIERNQICIAGDINQDKFNDIKIIGDGYTTFNDFNKNIRVNFHPYTPITESTSSAYDQNITSTLGVYYKDASYNYNLMQTHTSSYTVKGHGMAGSVTITSTSLSTRRITVSFTLSNVSSGVLTMYGGTYSKFYLRIPGSDATPSKIVDTFALTPGQSYSGTKTITFNPIDWDPALTTGEEISVQLYYFEEKSDPAYNITINLDSDTAEL